MAVPHKKKGDIKNKGLVARFESGCGIGRRGALRTALDLSVLGLSALGLSLLSGKDGEEGRESMYDGSYKGGEGSARVLE